MNRPDLFEHSVAVLVKAFFDGTLAKGLCAACAVGNLVAAGQGGTITRTLPFVRHNDRDVTFCCDTKNQYWGSLFTTADGEQQFCSDYLRNSEVRANIRATGYATRDLMRIEYAFETHTDICATAYHRHSEEEILDDQYRGLMAVLDVLFDIHEVEDAARPTATDRFAHPALAIPA